MDECRIAARAGGVGRECARRAPQDAAARVDRAADDGVALGVGVEDAA